MPSAWSRGAWAASKPRPADRKSTRLNSSHITISYAVFCLKKKKKKKNNNPHNKTSNRRQQHQEHIIYAEANSGDHQLATSQTVHRLSHGRNARLAHRNTRL